MWENKNNLIRFTLQPYKKDGMQVQKDKSVLFSPIGSTDPISNCRDGGMLHIARIYKPSKVILYFSDEMLAFEKTDHRYTRALSLLGENFLMDSMLRYKNVPILQRYISLTFFMKNLKNA